jgi:hypothetical protein
MKPSIKTNWIRGIMFALLVTLIGAKSCMVNAQSTHSYTYYGYGLSMGVPQYELNSNIPQLNGLKVNLLGFNLGGMIANKYGKLKANAGSFYSGSSMPYEIDMMQVSVSGNIYLLRLNEVKVHLFEPYATLEISQQVSKFYGDYLSKDPSSSSSSTSQPLLGKVNSARLNVGGGVELQLENDNQKFIHLFAEVVYGTPISSSASNNAFSQTKAMNSVTFNFGVNFGLVKIGRYKR